MGACEWAAEDVREDLVDIWDVLSEKFDTRPTVEEYPMVNAQISWVSLNKK